MSIGEAVILYCSNILGSLLDLLILLWDNLTIDRSELSHIINNS